VISRHSSGGPYEEIIGYSRVVRAGDWFFTAGCTAIVDGELVGLGDPFLQATTAFDVGLNALAKAGCARQHVVTTRMYISDRAHAEVIGRAHKDRLGDVRPAASMLVVAGFIDERMLVEIELTAYLPRHGL
jgi:enamine deaminase RidA (YjgF/YER057c/UK114 family)